VARTSTTGYTAIDAALVIIGSSLILAGLAWLVFGTDASSPDPADDLNAALAASLVLSWIGASIIAVSTTHVAFQLPPREHPSGWLSAAVTVGGVLGLLLAWQIPVSWLGFWPSTDPRSQPSHILAAVLFFGSFATVWLAIGTALLVSDATSGRQDGDR
jgi:hypothetical protein